MMWLYMFSVKYVCAVYIWYYDIQHMYVSLYTSYHILNCIHVYRLVSAIFIYSTTSSPASPLPSGPSGTWVTSYYKLYTIYIHYTHMYIGWWAQFSYILLPLRRRHPCRAGRLGPGHGRSGTTYTYICIVYRLQYSI